MGGQGGDAVLLGDVDELFSFVGLDLMVLLSELSGSWIITCYLGGLFSLT